MSRGSDKPGSVRIIAGQWRGRRLPVINGNLVRPTPDRVRETLFNWLAPVIEGARCLDLFAGSGSLGAEALSRGADEVCFVESDKKIASLLEETLNQFSSKGHRVVTADAVRFLRGVPAPYDIVFLDPPYGVYDLENLCTLLDAGWLAEEARIYLESARGTPVPALPSRWELRREKTAGQVRYALVGL